MDDADRLQAPQQAPPETVPMGTGALPEIDLYELDDIPLAHLPMPGSTTLTIAFRVGRADEPVTLGGMTHLTEHLVMAAVARGLDRSPDHSNGTTEPFQVEFTIRGTPGEASRFLADVCHAIEQPALRRMHEEANVLRTEGAGRSRSGLSFRAILYRTGFQGIGTCGLPELFLRNLDEAVLRSWIAENFVAGNAAIWIAGELPDDLVVSLPPGPRRPLPDVRWVPGLETPTIVPDEGQGIAVSFFFERSAAMTSALATLNSRLHRALRIDRGLGYVVGGESLPVTANAALATAFVTCLPRATADVERVMLETIDDLAARGPSDDELADQYQRLVRGVMDPMAIPGRLDAHVRDVLMGRTPSTAALLLEEQGRLESADVAAAFKQARDSMLLLVPNAGFLPQRPLRRYPGPLRDPVGDGRTFDLAATKGHAPWKKSTAARLTVGDLGVAVEDSAGRRLVGIPWAESVAILSEGRLRTLVGRDGVIFTIDPAQWRDGPGAVGMVDRLAPRDRVVGLGD